MRLEISEFRTWSEIKIETKDSLGLEVRTIQSDSIESFQIILYFKVALIFLIHISHLVPNLDDFENLEQPSQKKLGTRKKKGKQDSKRLNVLFFNDVHQKLLVSVMLLLWTSTFPLHSPSPILPPCFLACYDKPRSTNKGRDQSRCPSVCLIDS